MSKKDVLTGLNRAHLVTIIMKLSNEGGAITEEQFI